MYLVESIIVHRAHISRISVESRERLVASSCGNEHSYMGIRYGLHGPSLGRSTSVSEVNPKFWRTISQTLRSANNSREGPDRDLGRSTLTGVRGPRKCGKLAENSKRLLRGIIRAHCRVVFVQFCAISKFWRDKRSARCEPGANPVVDFLTSPLRHEPDHTIFIAQVVKVNLPLHHFVQSFTTRCKRFRLYPYDESQKKTHQPPSNFYHIRATQVLV